MKVWIRGLLPGGNLLGHPGLFKFLSQMLDLHQLHLHLDSELLRLFQVQD